MMSLQDPYKAYLVFVEGAGERLIELAIGAHKLPRIVPLERGVYFIARSRSRDEMLRLSRKWGERVVWLPTQPGPSRLAPVGRIEVGDRGILLYGGWPGRVGREVIEVRPLGVESSLSVSPRGEAPIPLRGFETISFQGAPPVSAVFVPPISSGIPVVPTGEMLRQVGEYGLWASAATGWEELLGDAQAAERCWRRAVEACEKVEGFCSPTEYASALLNLARLMEHSGHHNEEALEVRQRAFRWLKLPQVEYWSRRSVRVKEGEPVVELSLWVEMEPVPGMAVEELELRYTCRELGVSERYILRLQDAEGREKKQWVRQMDIRTEGYEPGSYPVEVVILLPGVRYQYIYGDVLIVPKRQGKIIVEKGGAVGAIVMQEGDDMDVHVKGDVGLIRIVPLS